MSLHLVLGPSTPLGAATVRQLRDRGEEVREFASTALNSADLLEASEGCASIAFAEVPPWRRWEPDFVRMAVNVVHAAQDRRATILFFGNLYGRKLIYDVPLPAPPPRIDYNDPPTRLGEIMNAVEDELECQQEEEDRVPLVVVRSGDLLPPTAWYGEKRAKHPFWAADEVARAAVDTLLKWPQGIVHVNAPVKVVATYDDFPGVRRIPEVVLRAAALVSPDAKDRAELRFHWHAPVLLDAS